ncbi:kinase-like domain-containing protein [Gigaspora rosea]|uniref:Kinase-like domain-containing protein n=1 Tax=Gigaspora rosea TaxID=44941 RepID=A0A397UHL7_9GLOM|nr:kinase-like domain-containing protein [Gigaspora rosea]
MNREERSLFYNLGWRYQFGIGVEKNLSKAFIFYLIAACEGDSYGMFQIGEFYYLGIYVKKNDEKAFNFFLKSAKRNNYRGILKVAICYIFEIGTDYSYDKFFIWYKKTDSNLFRGGSLFLKLGKNRRPLRNLIYGKCDFCDKNNTQLAWCQTCDPDKTIQEWTSGSINIDDYLKEFQFRATSYKLVIEWISFDKLTDITKIAEGGNGTVYSANWFGGIRKVDYENNDRIKARDISTSVALKTLFFDSEKKFASFLNEFIVQTECMLSGCRFRIFGLTQDNATKKYLVVFQYANRGSLHKFLNLNFKSITWNIKLNLLKGIIDDLVEIHGARYVHKDFHSGNILLHTNKDGKTQSYVSDFGLSRNKDENNNNGIYGVLPYVAPEVLKGSRFTQAADIYGLGVIMSEMSTGQRPFDRYEFDLSLQFKICTGLRPDFAKGTPECYKKLADQCMDSNPQNRPTIYDIRDKINEWINDKNEIMNQFLCADKITVDSLDISQNNPDHMYTSKLIKINQLLNQDSCLIDFEKDL